MFKIKDRVYDLVYGWGVVNREGYSDTYPIRVDFGDNNSRSYTLNGENTLGYNRTLFFCEPNFENVDYRNFKGSLYKQLIDVGNFFKTLEKAKNSKFYKVFHEEDK